VCINIFGVRVVLEYATRISVASILVSHYCNSFHAVAIDGLIFMFQSFQMHSYHWVDVNSEFSCFLISHSSFCVNSMPVRFLAVSLVEQMSPGRPSVGSWPSQFHLTQGFRYLKTPTLSSCGSNGELHRKLTPLSNTEP